MVKGEIKNYGKSNRTKLLNLSKQTKGADYNLILLRFVQERFLYRLSLSAYRENFFLKGGALLFAHERFAARPTRDMDFLGDHISRDKENIKRIMHEICSIECEEDGVTFECGEDEIWLEESLRRLRERMIGENELEAAVFVGGMAGVEQEYELVRQMQPEAKFLPVASTGGAAKAIFERGGFDARLGTREYREVFEEIA